MKVDFVEYFLYLGCGLICVVVIPSQLLCHVRLHGLPGREGRVVLLTCLHSGLLSGEEGQDVSPGRAPYWFVRC